LATIDEAAKRGYDTRVGFEDILTLPGGKSARNNGALVAEPSAACSPSIKNKQNLGSKLPISLRGIQSIAK
jgi:uncharacterized protein (DUF849 family)